MKCMSSKFCGCFFFVAYANTRDGTATQNWGGCFGLLSFQPV